MRLLVLQVDNLFLPPADLGERVCKASLKADREELALRLCNMDLTAAGAVARLACALSPAGQPISQLKLHNCKLSGTAWSPPRELAAVTQLELERCPAARHGGRFVAAVNAGLQHMPRLRQLLCSRCNFSDFPAALCQLTAITCLRLSSAGLSSLPPLACMTGVCVRLLAGRSLHGKVLQGSGRRLAVTFDI